MRLNFGFKGDAVISFASKGQIRLWHRESGVIGREKILISVPRFIRSKI